jgi:hypothetical protein
MLTWAVVLVALPLNWYVTAALWWLSRRKPGNWVMRERAVAATALSIIVTVFAVIFLNNNLDVPLLNSFDTQVITRATIFVLATAVAVYWLRLARRT